MFEGVIVGVLNQFLGQFLDGFTSTDLKLNVWSGNVDLHNVRIKSSGLDFLQLPIEIKSGYINKLIINANWRKLTSQPVKITIDGVYAAIHTRSRYDMNYSQILHDAIQNKLAALNANNQFKLQYELQKFIHAQQVKSGHVSTTDETTATARYISKIVENLQINVNDIHITYEDTIQSQSMTCGICLGSLTVFTTDDQWRRQYDSGTSQYSYKLVNLEKLFVYTCNTSKSQINRSTGLIQLGTPSSVLSDPNNHFIVESIDGFLRLRLNKQHTPQPKIRIESLIESIKLSMSETQYTTILRIISHISQAQQKLTSMMRVDEISQPGTPSQRHEYVELYKRTLNAMWLNELSASESNQLKQLEINIKFDTILDWRRYTWNELRRELRAQSPDNKYILSRSEYMKQQGGIVYKTVHKVGSWVSWATGYHYRTGSNDGHDMNDSGAINDSDNDNELQTDPHDSDNDTDDESIIPPQYPPEYKLVDAIFKLPQLSISLADTQFAPISILSIQGATVNVLKRPTSILVNATLDDMVMSDHYTQNTYYPELIQSVNKINNHILNLTFEQNPIDADVDKRIVLSIVSPQIVTHAVFIHRIIQFFRIPPDLDISELQTWTADQLQQLQQFSSIGISDSLKQHTSLDLQLHVQAPIIAVPVDAEQQLGDVLIIDLGEITLNSVLQSRHAINELREFVDTLIQQYNSIDPSHCDTQRRESMYDRQIININSIQVYFSSAGAQWYTSKSNDTIKSYLLRPVAFKLNVDTCVIPAMLFIPKLKLSADLGILLLTVSPLKYDRIMKLADSFKILGSTDPPDINTTSTLSQVDSLLNDLQHTGADDIPVSGVGDGDLDVDQLTKLMQSRHDAEQLMSEVDNDNSGTVSRVEFDSWYQKRKVQRVSNIKIHVEFIIQSIQLIVSDDSQNYQKDVYDILNASVDKIILNVLQREFDMSMGITVGALQIEDLVAVHDNSRYIVQTDSNTELNKNDMDSHVVDESPTAANNQQIHTVIPLKRDSSMKSTTDHTSFITVTYQQIQLESPEFNHANTMISIGLDIGSLHIILDRSAASRIATFVIHDFLKLDLSTADNNIDKSIQQRKHKQLQSAPHKIQPRTNTSVSDNHSVPHNHNSISNKKLRNYLIQIQLVARLQGISLGLTYNGHSITTLQIAGIECKLYKYPLSLTVQSQLNSITMNDNTLHDNVHGDIISTHSQSFDKSSETETTDKPLVTLKYSTYSTDELDYPGHDSSVRARLTGLHFTVINRFIQELIYYFTQGDIKQFLDTLQNHQSSTIYTLEHQQVDVPSDMQYNSGMMTQHKAPLVLPVMDIKIRDLEVIVPGSSKSSQHIRAAITQIDIHNNVRQGSDTVSYENVIIEVRRVFCETHVKRLHRVETNLLIELETINIDMDVMQHINKINCSVELPSLQLSMSPSQYQFLSSKLPSNFTEHTIVCLPEKPSDTDSTHDKHEQNRQVVQHHELHTAQPLSQLPTTSIRFALHSIDIVLSEDASVYEELDDDELTLIEFHIHEIIATASVQGGDIDTALHITELSLIDTSRAGEYLNNKPVLSVYRELLRLSEPLNNNHDTRHTNDNTAEFLPFIITYNRHQTTQYHAVNEISCIIQNLQFSMGSVLLRLTDFFVPPNVKTDDSDDIIDINSIDPTHVTNTAVAQFTVNKDNSSHGLTQSVLSQSFIIKLSVINPSLQLIADPTATRTTAVYITFGISMDCGIDINIDNKSFTVSTLTTAVQDLKCFICELDTRSDDFRRERTVPNESAVILQPVTMSGSISYCSAPLISSTPVQLAVPKITINVSISDVTLRFTYTSYRLMIYSINALTLATASPKQTKNQPIQKQLSVVNDGDSDTETDSDTDRSNPDSNNLDSNESILGPVLPSSTLGILATSSATDSPVDIGLFSNENIIAHIGTISCMFINDALQTDIPIAQCTIQRISVQLHGYAHNRSARIQIQLSADYYNLQLAVWEPMVEPAQLTATLIQTHILQAGNVAYSPKLYSQNSNLSSSSSSASSLKVVESERHESTDYVHNSIPNTSSIATWCTIATDAVLNINVTHAMFTGVVDTIGLLTMVEKHCNQRDTNNTHDVSKQAIDNTRFYPYVLDNCTEFNIQFNAINQRLTNDNNTTTNHHQPNMVEQLIGTDNQAAEQLYCKPRSKQLFDYVSHSAWSNRILNITLSGADNMNTINTSGTITIEMNKRMTHMYPITTTDHQRINLYIDNLVDQGIHYIRVRSGIGVLNKLSIDIQLSKHGITDEHSVTVRPNNIFWLPVLAPNDAPCVIRPVKVSAHADQIESSEIPYQYSQPVTLTHPIDSIKRAQYFVSPPHTITHQTPMFYGTVHAKRLYDARQATVDSSDDTEYTGTPTNKQGIKQVSYGTEYVIRPAVQVENLLANDIDIQLSSDSSNNINTGRYSNTVHVGDKIDIHTIQTNTKQPAVLLIRVPQLDTLWSTPINILRDDNTSEPNRQHLKLSDRQGRQLHLHCETSTLQGCIRIVLYCRYWLYDLTGLGLIPSYDKLHTVPLGDVNTFTQSITDDNKHPIMIDYPHGEKHRLRLCTIQQAELCKSLDSIKWSSALNISNAGFTGVIQCESTTSSIHSTNQLYSGTDEIGVAIVNGSGKFHRTKLVTLQPHYIIVNQLECDIEVRQAKTYRDIGGCIVSRKSQLSYHWPVSNADKVISYRRIGPHLQDQWQWSGMFDPAQVGDIYFTIRHKTNPNMLYYGSVSMRVNGASMYIVISQFQQKSSILRNLMPYRITNKCINTTIRIRQYSEQGILQYIRIPAYSSLPWSWEHPLLKGKIQLQINELAAGQYQHTITVPIDGTDDHVGVYKLTAANQQVISVYVYIHTDGPTRELIVSGYPNPSRLIDDTTVTSKQQLMQFRQQRLIELSPLLAQMNNTVRQLQQRRKFNYHSYRVQQQGYVVRPDNLPSKQAYLSIDITNARHLSIDHPIITITFENQIVKSVDRLYPNSLHYKIQLPVPDTLDTCTASCTIDIRDSSDTVTATGQPLAYTKFLLTELSSHTTHHMWQRLHPVPGHTHSSHQSLGELELYLQWIPSHMSVLEQQLHTDNIQYYDRKRILTSIQHEIDSIQSLTDSHRPITGNLEYQYLVTLWSSHGLTPLLNSLPDGYVVCVLQSLNTGKQCSVLISVHNDSNVSDSPYEWIQTVPFHCYQQLIQSRGDTIQLEYQLIPYERNTAPITIAHSAIPLAGIPVDDSKLQQQSDQYLHEVQSWLNKCVPLVCDIPGISYNDELSVHIGVRCSPAKSDEYRPTIRLTASIDIGVSLINEVPEELMYLTVSGLSCIAEDSYTQQTLNMKCDRIQLDNQMPDAIYDLILSASPVFKYDKQPLIQLSINKLKDKRPILIFPYISLLIQSIDVKVEEQLIWRVIAYINEFVSQTTSMDESVLIHDMLHRSVHDTLTVPEWTQQQIYCEFLQIQPIACNVSFQAKSGIRRIDNVSTVLKPIILVLSVVGTTLGSIDNAPIHLHGQLIEHAFNSLPVLCNTLINYYIRNSITQAYKLLGSFEAIGSPVGLLTNIGTGVYDFFYEPARGLVESPDAFGRGLAKGSISLLKNTFSSVFNSFSKISNTFSKGAAALSLDNEFIQSHQYNTNNKATQPTNAVTGLLQGASGLSRGIFRGITGVITDPIRGAQRDGASGLLRGMGKGAIGLFTKPTAGVFDLTTNTLKGIGNTASLIDNNTIIPIRVRPQRIIDEHGLQPISRQIKATH